MESSLINHHELTLTEYSFATSLRHFNDRSDHRRRFPAAQGRTQAEQKQDGRHHRHAVDPNRQRRAQVLGAESQHQ